MYGRLPRVRARQPHTLGTLADTLGIHASDDPLRCFGAVSVHHTQHEAGSPWPIVERKRPTVQRPGIRCIDSPWHRRQSRHGPSRASGGNGTRGIGLCAFFHNVWTVADGRTYDANITDWLYSMGDGGLPCVTCSRQPRKDFAEILIFA